MNLISKEVFLALFISLLALKSGFSQARFNVKAGFENWSLKDETDTGLKSHHSGQTVGFDMHVTSNRFLFAPGFHYHRLSVINKQESFQLNLGNRNHIHYFSIPVTIGYRVFDYKVANVAFLAGAESFFFFNLDSNDVGLKVDDMFGVTPALTGCIQTEFFSILTADIKYHYALHELIKRRSESILSGLSFEIGIIF